MIKVTDKHKCCGCEACAQRCPKQCITMISDVEGFLYPHVNETLCIDCGMCVNVCPVINQSKPKRPLNVYAAINPDENIRHNSSSGGIFTAFAEKVIDEGGVVFGALFNDEWEVVHAYVERVEDLFRLRGSKYVQSKIGISYHEVETFLKSGRIVLFSGTPCQVAGLNNYLRKGYDNLLTIEVVCHGVPSPKVWNDYISTLENYSPIRCVNMKDKTDGWIQYKITITGESGILSERASDNKYMLAFSSDLVLRPSCYQCPAKDLKSGSDITLADYWGVENLIPKMFDDKGTSFVCINTAKGQTIFNELQIDREKADYDKSIPYNSCIIKSTSEPSSRPVFWDQYAVKGIQALFDLEPIRINFIKRTVCWIKRKLQ